MKSPPIIKIIKPGTYTSVEGTKVTFSLADLQSAADAYDAVSDPAPLVIGHPTMDAPAMGWATALRIEDGHLVADPDPDRLEPAFAEAVRKGRYRKVSGRFYEPDSPNNPKPGSFYLQHIGFLGAAAPAVKGLGTVNFADAGDQVVTIDQPGAAQLSQETKVDKDKEVSFAEREAEIATREAAAAAKETALANREAAARTAEHEGHVAFAEGLVTAGKLAPAGKSLVVGLLDQLGAGPPSEGVSFGEGTGELAPAAALRKLLEGAQPLVSFGEHAKDEFAALDKAKGGVSFAAPSGYEADPKSLEIHTRALELQAQDSGLSYMDAVKRAGG